MTGAGGLSKSEWDESLAYQLRRASQAWFALWQQRVPDLTNPQFAVLLRLSQRGALDQTALGALVSVDRSTLTLLLDRLEARGWVTKSIDQTNRRRRIVELTDEGRRRLGDALAVADALNDEVQAQFDPDELRGLVRLLRLLGDMSPMAGRQSSSG